MRSLARVLWVYRHMEPMFQAQLLESLSAFDSHQRHIELALDESLQVKLLVLDGLVGHGKIHVHSRCITLPILWQHRHTWRKVFEEYILSRCHSLPTAFNYKILFFHSSYLKESGQMVALKSVRSALPLLQRRSRLKEIREIRGSYSSSSPLPLSPPPPPLEPPPLGVSGSSATMSVATYFTF